MQLYFEEHGIYLNSSAQLRKHLLEKLHPELVPSAALLRKIMKKKFNLSYSRLDKANTQYRNPKYNDKRMWVCRLLAQFIKEDAIIICVDESNFRHDALPSKQWQFNSKTLE
jgi:hypothetical protein